MQAPIIESTLTQLTPELRAQLAQMGLELPAEEAAPREVAPPPAAPAPTVSAADRLASLLATRSQGAGLLGAIDMDQVETRDFRLLPLETDIEAQIVSREVGKSKSGNDQMVIDLKVTFPTEYAGVSLRDYVLLDPHDPRRSWKFKSLCEACTTEIEGEEVPLLYNGRYIGDAAGEAFLGNVISFQVEHSEWDNKTYNKVKGGYKEGWQSPGLN